MSNSDIDPAIVDEVLRRGQAGENIEHIVQFMRDSGLDVSDSIWVLVQARVALPGDAKRLVFNSRAWADVKNSNLSFQHGLMGSIGQIE